MKQPAATIGLVDDDASVRRSLERLLKAAGFAVHLFPTAEDFLASANVNDLDCLILDVRMAELDGLALQERLRRIDDSLPVIFLTGHGDIPMSVRAVKAGAEDFLTKPVDEEVLLGAIEKALIRGRENRRDRLERQAAKARLDRLSPREYEVLCCLLSGALNKQVAAHLGIVEKTVKVHRAHILENMEVHSLTELARLCTLLGIEPSDCA